MHLEKEKISNNETEYTERIYTEKNPTSYN